MTRAPDLIFDTLARLFELHPAVKGHRGILNRATADLKVLGATPAEIEYRVGVYKATWPECECSPLALVKWWNRMAKMPKPKGAEKVRVEADKAIQQSKAWSEAERAHDAAVEAERAELRKWWSGLNPNQQERLYEWWKGKTRQTGVAPVTVHGLAMMKEHFEEAGQ